MENQSLSDPPFLQSKLKSETSISPSTNWSKLLLFTVLVLMVVLGLFLVSVKKYINQTSSQKTIILQPTWTPTQIIVSPNIIPTINLTTNPTVSWITYTNVEGYSIKYPISFTTQLIAAEAGIKEATPTSRNLMIFKSDSSEPYIERYINLDFFEQKPTYNQAIITKVMLGNRSVEKILLPNAMFDIYLARLSSKGFIEIYVSNDPTKKEVANQILSTFKFANQR